MSIDTRERLTEITSAWLYERGGDSPTFAAEGDGCRFVRSYFYGDNARANWYRALTAAKAGGFFVDSFIDDGDPAIVIDAGKLAAATN